MKENNKISNYISLFKNTKSDKLAVVANMLCQLSYDELNVLKKKVPPLFSSLAKANYLKRQSFNKVAASGYYFEKKDDICEYFGTLAFLFEQHKDILNLFVELLRQFEKSLLLGQYEECKKILDEINNKVSYSYWGADLEIKLSRLIKGISGATATYNKLFSENEKLSSLCKLSFQTSAIDVPFDSDVEHNLKRMPNQYTKEFYIFHSFPFFDNTEGSWIFSNSLFSIVDLYCGFIYCLDILSKETIKNEKFLRYFTIITNTINDDRIRKRLCLLNNNIDGIENEKDRQDIIIDYYDGKYTDVVEKGNEYFSKNPFDIPIMDLYVKSCIIQKVSIPEIKDNCSLIKRITYYYYRYLINNEYSDVFRKKLLNLCEVWYSMPSIKHLYLMIQDRRSNDVTKFNKNYWRSSCGLNIQDAFFYDSVEEKKSFVFSWINTNRLIAYVEQGQSEQSILDRVDFIDFQFYNNKKTPKVLKELDGLIEKKILPSFSRNLMCSFLFNAYLENKQIEEAIALFAREMTAEEHLDLTLLDDELINVLLDTDIDKQFSNPIDFAIFYTYVNAAPYKRYLSLKRFLKQKGVNKVSELNIDGDKKLRFFIENVADRQVLALHRLFKSSSEVIDERIMICKNLFDFYQDKRYLDEISALSKEQTISGLVQQVDDSKIYVDIENIKKKELKDKEFNVLFDVFKNTDDDVKILENKSPEILQFISLIQDKGLSLTLFSKDESMEIDYKYSLFKKLYLDVRDKFVFDPKYGLDYYLSTRIRHGTIDNQLRNHLQEYHLVTNTDDSGNYIDNLFWLNRFGYSKEIKDILNNFSKSADDLIFALKSELIQIKTEDDNSKPKAIFDFSSENLSTYMDDLYFECSQTDFDNCVSLFFNKLWEYTEVCLSQMRSVLEDTHNLMRQLLDDLYNDISRSLQNKNSILKEFKDSITSCQTYLQLDFSKVQSWFQRKDVSTFDFSIQQVFEASMSAINRINQDELSIQKRISSTSSYKGEYFGAMHDLFHDILNNILDYEKKRKNIRGKAVATIVEKDSVLYIEVTNPIVEDDVQSLQSIVKESKEGYSSLINKGRSRLEGKSGFAKIYNIVTNVFESKDNQYHNSIDNNNLFKVNISINVSNLIRQ
ncbi:MAG: hypothetical protein IKP45_11985 [Bacteroidales bacterium]|nr:hypothetical protein [Bacteroidales bacterium]